mmetsp:Transcript_31379/g.27722  ORF Transcript_31379/g.27722 Transcript_31379/m.27722 type:complete len:145 (+) Transcript_31379:98-532(+)
MKKPKLSFIGGRNSETEEGSSKNGHFTMKAERKVEDKMPKKMIKVFEEVAESKLENRHNLKVNNFGFKSTPYYEYFHEKYDKAHLDFEYSNKKLSKLKTKREEEDLYQQLENKFDGMSPTRLSAKKIKNGIKYDKEFHNLLKEI